VIGVPNIFTTGTSEDDAKFAPMSDSSVIFIVVISIFLNSYAKVTLLLPMQNHLLLIYCSVQASPILANVIVPVPLDFQPALVTVNTMLPPDTNIANVFICPGKPAATVPVQEPVVLNTLGVTCKFAAPPFVIVSTPVVQNVPLVARLLTLAELMIILPFAPDKPILPSVEVKLTTPVLVIVNVFVLASLLAVIPIPLAKLLYGLACANKVAKLSFVLLKAVYNESLFADSFCNPTAIISSPEIAIF
jgi:hypothetical protein